MQCTISQRMLANLLIGQMWSRGLLGVCPSQLNVRAGRDDSTTGRDNNGPGAVVPLPPPALNNTRTHDEYRDEHKHNK